MAFCVSPSQPGGGPKGQGEDDRADHQVDREVPGGVGELVQQGLVAEHRLAQAGVDLVIELHGRFRSAGFAPTVANETSGYRVCVAVPATDR
jgi:hypothetical protein